LYNTIVTKNISSAEGDVQSDVDFQISFLCSLFTGLAAGGDVQEDVDCLVQLLCAMFPRSAMGGDLQADSEFSPSINGAHREVFEIVFIVAYLFYLGLRMKSETCDVENVTIKFA
jgi:hypothetical protein